MPDWSTFISALKATTAGPAAPFVNPSSLAGLTFWFDASSGAFQNSNLTIACSGGDSVGAWADRSSISNHVFSNGTSRPTYVLAVSNSKNVVRFDGLTQAMSSIVANSMDAINFSYFCVMIRSNTSNTNGVATVGGPVNSSGARGFGFSATPGNAFRLRWQNATNLVVGSASILASTTASLVYADYNSLGTGNIFFNNSMEATSSNLVTFNTGNTLKVGFSGSLNFAGDIAEMVFYDSVLSASNRNLVANYLAAKYAIWST